LRRIECPPQTVEQLSTLVAHCQPDSVSDGMIGFVRSNAVISSLIIDNFRCFQHFEMHGLGRVNLLVGKNNSGKTSLLEAVELLAAQDPAALLSVLQRRSEWTVEIPEAGPVEHLVVRHLFFGHAVNDEGEFSIGDSDTENQVVVKLQPPAAGRESNIPSLCIEGRHRTHRIKLSSRLTAKSRSLYLSPKEADESPVVQVVSTSSLDTYDVLKLLSDVLLTPNEQRLIEALRVVEPRVERIAVSPDETGRFRQFRRRGGIKVKLSDSELPVPITVLGDGVWRLMAISLALVQAKNGYLLVDEIDTGLHYTALSRMWNIVYETARRLNVQVFATTHSRDCYESLAEIARDVPPYESEITIQRIEREQGRAVSYTEQEILAAAEHHIEVR